MQQTKEAISVFQHILRKYGGRLTEERQALLHAIRKMDGHFQAEDVHRALSKLGHRISLTTVYRNLDLIVEAGIIRRLPITDGDRTHMQFEYIWGQKHHDHLICLGCGKEVEFSYPAIDVLQEQAAKENGFLLLGHHLVLQGVCPDCQKQKEAENPEAAPIRLIDLKAGGMAQIVGFTGNKSLVSRMNGHGLFEGRVIRLVRFAPFGGPILIQDMESGARVMTSRETATSVLVREVTNGD